MVRIKSDDFPVNGVKLNRAFKTGVSGKKINVEALHIVTNDPTKQEQTKPTKTHAALETELQVRLLNGKKRLSIEITETDFEEAVERAEYKKQRAEQQREQNKGGFGFGGFGDFGDSSDDEDGFGSFGGPFDHCENSGLPFGNDLAAFGRGYAAIEASKNTRVVQFEFKNINMVKRSGAVGVKVKADTAGHCYKKPKAGTGRVQLKVIWEGTRGGILVR